MLFDLDDDTQLLQRTVREFAVGEVAPVAEELDRTKAFPYELVSQDGRARAGWASRSPRRSAARAARSLQYAIAVEELTRVDSSVAITMCAHTSLGTQPIYLFGSDEQKARLLPDLCAGAQARRVRADRARGRLATPATSRRARRSTAASGSIDGAKQFITNAGHRHLRPRGDHRAHGRATRSPTSSSRTARRATSRASRIARWAGTRRTRGR